MKNLILDHFRRWWWVWLIGAIGYALVTVGVCVPYDHHKSNVAFPLGFFLGAFLLNYDLQRGHAHTLLAMPVSVKQIGRAWWWASVGLPALILGMITALVIGIMSLIATLSHTKPIQMSNGLNYWLTTSLLIGTMFFALTGMNSRPGGGLGWQRIRSIFFGILWGGMIAVWIIFKHINLETQAGVIIFVATSILTLIGWFRAEMLVEERTGLRLAFQSSPDKNAKPSRCADGHGGLTFLCETIFVRMTLIGLFMFGMFILLFGLILHGILIPTVGHASTNVVLGGNTTMFTFQFWWVMSFQMFQFAYHLRFLRTLPVSTEKLAGVLVFTPLFAMITTLCLANLLLAAALQSPPLPFEKLFSMGFFLQIALASAFTPLLIWRGMDRLTYFLMIVVMMVGMFSSIFLKSGVPAPVSIAISLLIPLGSFLITLLLLDRSSTTYRPRTNLFPGWQMGAGR